MTYFVLRLWRLDDTVRERTLGLRLSTKQSSAIEEIWTFLSADEAATDSTAPVVALDCHSALDDDQGHISEGEEFYVGQGCKSSGVADHGIFNESVIPLQAETQQETCASSVRDESSNALETYAVMLPNKSTSFI